MDLCKYAYYNANEKYCPNLYCNRDNKRCIYSKKCLKVDKFIPLEGEMWRECPKFIMAKISEIPTGSYFVQTARKNKRGKLYLYVLVNDKIERILSDFTKLEQDYVYLKKENDSYKVVLEPFKEEPKKLYIEPKIEEEEIKIKEEPLINEKETEVEVVTEKKRGRKKKVELVEEVENE